MSVFRPRGIVVGRTAAALLAVALVASVYLTVRRGSPQERQVGPVIHRLSDQDDRAHDGGSRVTAAGNASHAETAAAALRASSPTFRNGTLLIAIRRAGFYCDDVVDAQESGDGLWVAGCADMRGYTVSVRDAHGFDVRPIAHYFDAQDSSRPIQSDQYRLDRDPPLELLPQQRFRR